MADINLGDNYSVDEDENGDLIIQHDPSGDEIKYDSANGGFVGDSFESLTSNNLAVGGQQYDIGWEHITTVDLAVGTQTAESETVSLSDYDEYEFHVVLQTESGTDINMSIDGVANGDYGHLTRNGSTLSETTNANNLPLISAQSFRSGGATFRYIASNDTRPIIYGNGGSHLFLASTVLVEGAATGATNGKEITFSTPDARFAQADIEVTGRNLR